MSGSIRCVVVQAEGGPELLSQLISMVIAALGVVSPTAVLTEFTPAALPVALPLVQSERRKAKRAVVVTDPVTHGGGAGKWDLAVTDAVRKHPHGIGLTDVGRAVGASSGQMFSVLKRLVRDGVITKTDGLYRPAGKPAKEAP